MSSCAPPRARRPVRACLAILGVVIGALAPASPARAAEDDDAPKQPLSALHAERPGPRLAYAPRPVLGREMRACSQRVPVCVHGETGAAPSSTVLETLGALERAWLTLTGPFEMPPPDLDPETLTYDVYLVDPASLGAEIGATVVAARDVRSAYDRASSFTLVDRGVRAGCVLDALAAREIAHAILHRLAPGTDAGSARATTTYLSHLVAPCALGLAIDSASAFQSHPERALADPHADGAPHAYDVPADSFAGTWTGGALVPRTRPSILFAQGASLAWSRIDWAFGRNPGALVSTAWTLAATKTALGAARWHHQPDLFDVLRLSFKNALSTGSTIHDLFLELGVARMFYGSADDGFHQPETRTLGPAAVVRPDWDVPWPAKPRRFAPREPVYPTGTSALVIHTDGAPKGARLRAEIAWEEHALFRWAFVKLDKAGRELGRLPIPTRERAIETQMTLVDLEGVDRVLLVGVNVGDPAYTFDPDDEVWEPHGWLVTVAAE
jgi:hypothetical protein